MKLFFFYAQYILSFTLDGNDNENNGLYINKKQFKSHHFRSMMAFKYSVTLEIFSYTLPFWEFHFQIIVIQEERRLSHFAF